MKPNFALNLTDDSIALLHRTARGWMEVGSTPLDAPDLGEALNYLRRSALGLAPHGIATKLVIPNSQILYLEVEAPGSDADYRRARILKALEGRTPYAVEDLVFDWSGKGPTVQVAVIARETLDEAEQFAAQYRFNPVSFVAIPPKGQFDGEPWFGPSALAATLLAKDDTVERDTDAVAIVARDLPREPARAEPAPEQPDPIVAEIPASPLEMALKPTDEAPFIAVDIAEDAAAPEAPPADPAPASVSVTEDHIVEPAAQMLSKMDAIVADAFPGSAADLDATPLEHPEAPPFASRRAPDPVADISLDLKPAQDRAAARAARQATPQPADTRPSARITPEIRPESSTVAPPSPVTDTLASAIAASTQDGQQTRKPLVATPDKGLRKDTAAPVTAPTIPGRKPKAAISAAPRQPDAKAAAPGAFGARKPPQRGKPRYLGLILTAILLVFLALVAAWSSFYLASWGEPEPTAVAATDPAATDAPGVDDEMLADLQDPASLAQDAEAAAAAEAPPETPAAEPVATATPAPEAAPLPETPAAVESAGPAPVAGADASPALSPSSDAQDEIFLATVDARPVELDALALPKPDATPDVAPVAQMPAPPFGTLYEFDANGLIKPTPEGILTPDGVFLIAGPPARIPPPRPVELIAAAQAAAQAAAAPATVLPTAALPTTEVTPETPPYADPALADFKPRPRPENLAPILAAPEDQTSLAIPEGSRLTSLRPRARPAAIVALANAARNASAAASLSAPTDPMTEALAEASLSGVGIAVSRKPVARPKDFTKAVEAAVAAAVRPTEEPVPEAAPDPAPEPTQEAAVSPDAEPEPDVSGAAPRATQRGTVAKQATFANAINLSKMNLIGVYGTSNNRYAMIRQPNGRYKKVKVGDRVDGGTVAAITQNEVRYQKGGRLISLKMPKG